MSASEKFCLRWNDFETNISVAFRELREEKDFFDVTLACDDSQIQAHKVILSACSPFFRNVLRRNPHQHPLLYLKGVKYKELLSVLNFMYMGEVNVAQEELNSFLSVAEDLRVKGLTQNNSNSEAAANSKVNLPKSEPLKQITRPREPPERDPVPPPKRPRPTPVPQAAAPRQSYQPEEEDDIQEVVPVKSEPRDTFVPSQPQPSMSHTVAPVEPQPMYQPQDQSMQEQGTVALDDTYGDESYDYGQYGDGAYDDGSGMIDPNTGMPLAGAGADGNKVSPGGAGRVMYGEQNESSDALVRSKMVKSVDGEWQCTECNFVPSGKTALNTLYAHVESNHVSVSFVCYICFKECKTRNSLLLHRSRYHKNM
eukprot:GFUD01016939.1.p1 GENE.GFUD01016939.1~~GFUD01016939.1.p1  ORF type:complete len:368 (-),score=78.43 GFUD01016939.1:68-1171(-)